MMSIVASERVLLVDKLLSEEGLFAEAEPVLAIELAFRPAVQVLQQALRALFHHLFELIDALGLFCWRARGLHQAELVHEECLLVCNVDGFDVRDDLADYARGGILLREANHLLEALLDEASQVDDAAVTSALNLVILE